MQEVLLLLLVQLQLQDELLLRKIKEQDGFYPMKMIYNSNLNLVMEGLENSSYRCMFSSYSCVNIWSKRIV